MNESLNAEFCSAADYSEKLLKSIDSAESRVMLETMVLDNKGEMKQILEATVRARARGAAALVIYDRYTFASYRAQHGFEKTRRLKAYLKDIESSGVNLKEVGSWEINPFASRHHAKAAIIDDEVFIGGGVNLTGYSFQSEDFMWRFEDSDSADTLHERLPEVAATRSQDEILQVNDDFEVLIDAGTKGESIIYDRTCQLAEELGRVYYVSKLIPDGKLGQILADKQTEYWYGTMKTSSLFDKLALVIDSLKSDAKNNYDGDKLLHAKLCVFVMPDSSLQAISGSHNFNYRGVAFGTQEVALHIKNQTMCQSLIDFAKNLG